MQLQRSFYFGLFFLLAFHPSFSFCAPSDSSKIFVGAGSFTPFAGRLTNTNLSDGSTSLTSGTMASLAFTGQFLLYKSIGFSPLIAYTPFGHKSNDGGEKSHYLPIAFRINRRFKLLDFRVGPGMLYYSVKGNGGTVTLSNGGSTSVFALPSQSATAHFFFVDFGMGAATRRLRLDLDGLVSGDLSKRRAISILASASIGFF